MQVIVARENMYATKTHTHTQHAAVDWSLFLQIIFTDFLKHIDFIFSIIKSITI